jgi:hypothetical protein
LVVARAARHDAEGQQDADGADVGDQQVEEAGAADFGVLVVGGDEEERRQRHALPGHHEGVGVVGEQHHEHAGEEEVVLEAQQPRRRALALAEITGAENRDADRDETDQHGEDRRQVVQAQMERQVGQADGEHGDLRRFAEGVQGDDAGRHADQGARREQYLGDEARVARRQQPGQSDREPSAGGDQQGVDGQQIGHVRGRVKARL